jgi:hypothetical protein
LVVTLPVDIFSLNVATIVVETATPVELSAGLTDEMVGLLRSEAPFFS